MSTVTQERGSGRRAKRMSTSRVQKRAHPILTTSGYHWVRTDRNEHNLYHNDAGQVIDVASSPKNESSYLKLLQSRIKTHDRERQTVATESKISVVDQLMAGIDPFILKDPGNARHAVRARAHAMDAWLKRTLEKRGPTKASDLEAVADRLGMTKSIIAASRSRIGTVAFREKPEPGSMVSPWMVCFPHQVPEGKTARGPRNDEPQLGVAVEAPEPEPERTPAVIPPLDSWPAGALAPTNGKRELTDQQAAFLMMAESLGMPMPGDEAKAALNKAHAALIEARNAVEAAMAALA